MICKNCGLDKHNSYFHKTEIGNYSKICKKCAAIINKMRKAKRFVFTGVQSTMHILTTKKWELGELWALKKKL